MGFKFAAFTDGRSPKMTPIAMEKAMRFAIREGGRTVGAGRISEILD